MSRFALNWTIAQTLAPKGKLQQAVEIGYLQSIVDMVQRNVCALTLARVDPPNDAEMVSATADPALTDLTRRQA